MKLLLLVSIIAATPLAAQVKPDTSVVTIIRGTTVSTVSFDTAWSKPTAQDVATLRAMVEHRDPARDTTVALKLRVRGDTAMVTVTHRNGGRIYRMERSRTEKLGWVLCKTEMVFVY